jgi:hypothetical protein
MRSAVLSFSYLSSVLLVSGLVLFTQVLWAQKTSTLEGNATRFPDAPSRVAGVSEAQTHLHLTCKGSALSFAQNPGQTESWLRFFPHDADSGTGEFWLHHEIHSDNDLEYYGHHIPWAGSLILRIGKQAKAHPHITSVVKSVHPKL